MNKTFTILKPDSIQNRNTGKILDDIINAGFSIKALKLIHMSEKQAKGFYAVHKERPFYMDLVSYMSSGPSIVAVLEKENAVQDFRKLIGATNPKDAEEGTIRKKYAESLEKNAIHGSDSDENATIESNYFFSEIERI